MLFNTIDFFLFLTPIVIIYGIVPRKYNWVVLFVSSNIFVGLVSIESLLVLYSVSVISFFTGIWLSNRKEKKEKKVPLYTGVLFMVAILSFYKYIPFFINLLQPIINLISSNAVQIRVPSLLLPVGISFYVFQAIGYLLSIYRGQIKVESCIKSYFTYMFFFPKLLSGPIERSENFLPQLQENNILTFPNIVSGIKLFILGLFKKIVVADRLAIYVNSVYNNYQHHSSYSICLAAFFYVIQIYTDFSGYTDMARGIAKIFGYNLMENFERPILAQNISNFWRRWHISLTKWATDYIYYPIHAKRRDWNTFGIFYATLFTFLLIGIWHGPTMNFVLFGFIQVLIVFFEFLTKKFRKKVRSRMNSNFWEMAYRFISWTLTFMVITFSMIVFRIRDMDSLVRIFKQICVFNGALFIGLPSNFIYSVFGIWLVIVIDLWKEFWPKNFLFNESNMFIMRQLPYFIFAILILLIGVYDGGQFIYFQF